MNQELLNIIFRQTGASKLLSSELIQDLWSGYGELLRLRLDSSSVILKLIQIPDTKKHPRSWNSNIGHQRKIKSYEVETHWYKNFNQEISTAKLPKYIASGKLENDQQYLILEDLKELNFYPAKSLSWQKVKLCIQWLAHFHKTNLNRAPIGLWPIGSYWHLKTRPEELEAMDDLELKLAAAQIDEKLNAAKFKTIIHGDAKLANFLFSKDACAAVDFQYVGGGIGMKDLAYFMSSIYEESDLQAYEKKCLDSYFETLALPDVEKEWRDLYAFAWADFYRFLQGWAPGHRKLNLYSEKMRGLALSKL
ncbi:MAG: phosphotransferase [Bdellovibrionota bacterium]|nr:phosphotransferase [Bdellovibrionota bacterium]